MSSAKNRLQQLRLIFKGISFITSSKITKEVKEIFDSHNVNSDSKILLDRRLHLEKLLKKAKRDFNKAKDKFNRGEIDKIELLRYELEVIDITAEINDINQRLSF